MDGIWMDILYMIRKDNENYLGRHYKSIVFQASFVLTSHMLFFTVALPNDVVCFTIGPAYRLHVIF